MRLSVGFGLAFSCFACTAVQASPLPSVFHSEASLSGLSLQLRDFWPHDGIAPSLTNANPGLFNLRSSWHTYDSAFHGVEAVAVVSPGWVFDSSTLTASLASGQNYAAQQGNKLTAVIDVQETAFHGLGTDHTGMMGEPGFDSFASFGSAVAVLSPGTELTISGLVHLDVSINPQALLGLALAKDLSLRAGAGFYLSGSDHIGTPLSYEFDPQGNISEDVRLFRAGTSDDASTASLDMTFAKTFRNGTS